MHYLAPLGVLGPKPEPLSNILWHNPKPQLLNPKILRHQTIGRCSIQAEANIQDPL